MLLKPNLAGHHTGADTSRGNIFDEHEFITMRSARSCECSALIFSYPAIPAMLHEAFAVEMSDISTPAMLDYK